MRYIFMEVMKFILVPSLPSLEHIALVKTVTVLWNQEDIRGLILIEKFDCDACTRIERWLKIEKKVMEKVSLLPQPGPMKEKILGVIKPIGLEIFTWVRRYNVGTWSLAVALPVELGWTPQGTLDRKKTAETLIRNETLDITERYKLACIYCLKNAVEELWGKMPESHKASFRHYSVEKFKLTDQHQLIIFWTCDINGELDKIKIHSRIADHWRQCTAYQYAFHIAALNRNIAAVQYFLGMQTPVEREESLSENKFDLSNRYDSGCFDVFRFLFLQMDEEQQQIRIKKNAYGLLLCFLNWPRQSLFMEMANCVGHFLDSDGYYDLLEEIVDKIIDGFTDYNYENVFEELWMQSPTTRKKYAINEGAIYACSPNALLHKLFQVNAKKCISLIFKDATLEEKEDIIFNRLDICKDLACSNQWDFLEFFIGECLSTQERLIEFKDKCKKEIRWPQLIVVKDAKWNYFQFLDNLILKGDKRRDTEDENGAPAKKICIAFK